MNTDQQSVKIENNDYIDYEIFGTVYKPKKPPFPTPKAQEVMLD